MELSREKSEDLAAMIEIIKLPLHAIDIDYAKAVVKALLDQAEFQDAAAVLNPMYDPERSNIFRLQAQMLQCLVEFITIGKEVDRMKASVSETQASREGIMKMFM